MANCLLSLLACLKNFILGSLRMILFFGCLIMFLMQLGGMLVLLNTTVVDDLPNQNAGFTDYLSAFGTMATYLLGCYASFYKHLPSLKVFVIIIFFSTVIQTIHLLSMTSTRLVEKKTDDMFRLMSSYMSEYDWSAKTGANNKANRAWDTMQKVVCCGVKGPDDWDKYRPPFMKSNSLPASCCLPIAGLTCTFNDAFTTGCRDRWEQVQMFSISVYAFYIIFQSFLFFIGFISVNPNSGCCSQQQSGVSASENGQQQQGQQQVLPNQYQKLEHSVYVRQPAYNPIAGDTKKSGIAYPNLDQQPSYQPPPSYGSRA